MNQAGAPVPVHVYRPVGALIMACLSGASLIIIVAVIAFALPEGVRGSFTIAQDATLVLILGTALAVLYGIGRTQVRTDGRGLHVVNGFRRHDVSWPEAVTVSLGRGAPWAVLDTADGDTVQLMGIQRSDGARAVRAVREVRASIATHGSPAGDVT
ncbi:MAG: PH domain-containing protein [Nocardioidaceae bacterium]|nr:PH domain-containing protein [Nocardioidaceae bacterium]